MHWRTALRSPAGSSSTSPSPARRPHGVRLRTIDTNRRHAAVDAAMSRKYGGFGRPSPRRKAVAAESVTLPRDTRGRPSTAEDRPVGSLRPRFAASDTSRHFETVADGPRAGTAAPTPPRRPSGLVELVLADLAVERH